MCVFPLQHVTDSCGVYIVKYALIVFLFSYEDLFHTSFLVVLCMFKSGDGGLDVISVVNVYLT